MGPFGSLRDYCIELFSCSARLKPIGYITFLRNAGEFRAFQRSYLANKGCRDFVRVLEAWRVVVAKDYYALVRCKGLRVRGFPFPGTSGVTGCDQPERTQRLNVLFALDDEDDFCLGQFRSPIKL